jgi:hypothetical protein
MHAWPLVIFFSLLKNTTSDSHACMLYGGVLQPA